MDVARCMVLVTTGQSLKSLVVKILDRYSSKDWSTTRRRVASTLSFACDRQLPPLRYERVRKPATRGLAGVRMVGIANAGYPNMKRRPWTDAPAWLRCETRVTLSDGTHAQCGRYHNESFARNRSVDRHICTQHGNMLLAGKPLVTFWNGQLTTLRRQS